MLDHWENLLHDCQTYTNIFHPSKRPIQNHDCYGSVWQACLIKLLSITDTCILWICKCQLWTIIQGVTKALWQNGKGSKLNFHFCNRKCPINILSKSKNASFSRLRPLREFSRMSFFLYSLHSYGRNFVILKI